jgi:hypothetical protein
MVFHLTGARIGAEGNERSTEVHRSARRHNKHKFDKEGFRFYETKIADEAHPASPYTPNMAQPSVRCACGFVLSACSEPAIRQLLVNY